MKNILIEDGKGNITDVNKKLTFNLSESLSEISEATGDQNIVEGILLNPSIKVSEEALYEFMNEGFLSEENVIRIVETAKNELSIAEKRAAYAIALEEGDALMDKIRSVQAAKMVLKEEVFKKYGKKARIRVKHLMDAISPSIDKKVKRGLIEEV